MTDKILAKAVRDNILSKEDIVVLLTNESQQDKLFKISNEIRKKYVGDEIHLRGLIEFSNICKQNCLYCGLRYENKAINRYRLTSEQVIECAKQAVNLGFKTIVLQSGEDAFFDTEKIVHIISEIKKLDVAVTLSIGEKTFDEYLAFKNAGADRYLLRIETTDKKLYEKYDPNMSWENRRECLLNLKKLGYETGTGCLVGLPEQTMDSIADDILFFKEINADMIGIGPFIPNKNTPLNDAKTGDLYLSLRAMAIVRLLMPDINIPATTAMETLNPNGRVIALQSGANVVMPNVTLNDYKKFYEIYPGKSGINENPEACKDNVVTKIKSIGRTISQTKGFRQKGFKIL